MNKSNSKTGVRLDPATRRQQILDAAIAYFAEAGFGVQTRELTRRIGVSQPLLYRYFPSKQELIQAVFDAVFMRRWDPSWEKLLHDRSIDLRERLLQFYVLYAKATYRPEWIRIYMYAGLADMGFNRNYLTVVRKKLLLGMCEEFRAAFVPSRVLKEAPTISGREVELVWNLHGSMFYWAVRQHIFGSKLSGTAFEDRTADAVDLFLAGAQVQYPIIVAQEAKAAQSKSA
ncbi:MAG: TetR/AcrR family transcriptional regulator [Alphaproteobacteria bacterium]|nr:TetR/AcrR family transcriptional regulator [Alphaproteobacteria bacterium]